MAKRSDIKQTLGLGADHETLGIELGKIRRSRSVGQQALAAKLGISGPNLSRIEHGADFRVSTLLDLARALKLEPILVPKEHVPAVRAIVGATGADDDAPPERGRFT
ncbi:MAG TPA: helix-turn-helix transcriptional regulator [Candidatus Elarobacter sp.]|nr:helix-turn-helix transcriptional regulator [Candidatus Elarobacter sp.]HEV2740417.1 helix-turn-helix transcriptional regulator [Candidatus Elarobacter sp.]